MAKRDPIGVSDVPEAADEYDRYIGEVYDLLKSGATDKEIARYLIEIETDRMGLTDKSGNPLLPAEIRNTAVSKLKQANFFPEVLTPTHRRGSRIRSFLERVS